MTAMEFSSEHSHTVIMHSSLLEILTQYLSLLVFLANLTQSRATSEEGTPIEKFPLTVRDYLD